MASVAEIIDAHEDDIMTRWRDAVRSAASARGLSNPALENVMGLVLESLSDDSESETNGTRRRHVQSHLSARLRQGFDLAEIVDEFVLLGRSIARTWQALPSDQWPSSPDQERLHARIQTAIVEVTDAFYRHMRDDEQSEKRYLLRLQTVASEALKDADVPLRGRLRDFLEVVVEAMGAECGAFLLYDTSSKALVLEASIGAPAMQRYTASLDPTSFVGELAGQAEPRSIFDTHTTILDVPDSLRGSGIRALLGVRLPSLNELLGVMLIGVADAREFSSRELRRIEALGERIGLHLENARLVAALRDKVDALNVEKALRERFVMTLAHDLRGPLSAARLAAELVASGAPNIDKQAFALKIENSISRVDRMIDDLLDANRIHAGEPLPLRLAACDLGAIVEQVAEQARSQNGDRFVVEVDEPVRGIWSEDVVRRALWNLVTNAVKYGAPKEPITIAVGRDGDVVHLSVHNVGTPIPAEHQVHIFDIYARGPGAGEGGRSGWGLGLALVRGAAEAHGGRVSLRSDAESGTTFTIELPVEPRCAPAVTSHAAAPH